MTPEEFERLEKIIKHSTDLLVSEVQRLRAENERLKLPIKIVKKAVAEIQSLEDGIQQMAQFMADRTVFGEENKTRPSSYFRKDMRHTKNMLKLKDILKEVYKIDA